MNAIMQCCFAMGIPGSARLLLANKGEPGEIEGRVQVLTSLYFSSVVIDSLCECCSSGTTSILTSPVTTAKPHSGGLPAMGTGE